MNPELPQPSKRLPIPAPPSAHGSPRAPVRHMNDEWAELPASTGARRHYLEQRLHRLLTSMALAEARRRAWRIQAWGIELEDIASQAADDALLAISRKLHQFRGDSKFTTWAYRFVSLEVARKIDRHPWRQWSAAEFEFGDAADHDEPVARAEARDMLRILAQAIDSSLTDHQRAVFIAAVIDAEPTHLLAQRLHSSRNAIHKTVFDARERLRASLAAAGY